MSLLFSFIILIILIGVDQITKYFASIFLTSSSIPLINDILELQYVKNRGAAFSIFQNKTIFLIVDTIVIIAFILYYYIKIPSNNKYKLLKFTLILILAGAIGNLIDRVFLNYVVDFIYFKPIDFPKFNIADMYVSIGSIILLHLIILKYRDDELI